MNKTEYKKWQKTVLKNREQWVVSAMRDIDFAEKQLKYWTEHLKISKDQYAWAVKSVDEWKEGMK